MFFNQSNVKTGKGKMEKGLLRLRKKVQKALMGIQLRQKFCISNYIAHVFTLLILIYMTKGLSAKEIEEVLNFLPSTPLQVDDNECQAKNTGDLQEHKNLTTSYRQLNFGNARRPGVKHLDQFAVYRVIAGHTLEV